MEKAMIYKKMSDILEALEFLKVQAKQTRNEDVINLIDSTFNIFLVSYNTILRQDMLASPPSDAA